MIAQLTNIRLVTTAHDSEIELTDGWSQLKIWCALFAEDMQEQGTNIMFTAHGNQRSRLLKYSSQRFLDAIW